MTAACHILIAVVFKLRGVIRMAGPWTIPQFRIITGAGVGIGDDGSDGRTAGISIQNTRKKFRYIRFLAGGGEVILPGRSPV